jgi:hypothetical protein
MNCLSNRFFADYIVTADLSLVPDSYSVEGETYKFTSVCSATFDAVYNASDNRYTNKYAAATILAIGLLCSAYVAGGKTRRLCTGNREDTNDVENDFVEMNKIDDDAEKNVLKNEVVTSQLNENFRKETTQSKRLFPDFFRRQVKPEPMSTVTESIAIACTEKDQKNTFVAL